MWRSLKVMLEGLWVPGIHKPASKSLSTNEHTNAKRLTLAHTHAPRARLCASSLHLILFSPQTKPQTLSRAHTWTVRQQRLSHASNQHASDEQNTGQMYSREKFLKAYVQHSWPLHTADLWYSNPASFKTRDLSHTCLSYQHKSKSKSADVSYPVFQREKHLTWSPIPYEDYVFYPMWPHQIIMQSKILNPQEPCWEKLNCFVFFFFCEFLKSQSFWKVSAVFFLWGLTYVVASGGFSRR